MKERGVWVGKERTTGGGVPLEDEEYGVIWADSMA